jgi:hypothetical protein
MMTDLLIIIGFIFGMMCVYVLGEVGCYRRGGDVYWWAKALDKYVPKRWK